MTALMEKKATLPETLNVGHGVEVKVKDTVDRLLNRELDFRWRPGPMMKEAFPDSYGHPIDGIKYWKTLTELVEERALKTDTYDIMSIDQRIGGLVTTVALHTDDGSASIIGNMMARSRIQRLVPEIIEYVKAHSTYQE